MIFTLFYMYATALQWWRLGVLKNKLSGTLNSHNALLVCSNANFVDRKRRRCLENLLVQKEDRIACTIVPKQVLDLTQWAAIPRDNKYFPIFMDKSKFVSKCPKIYVVLQTNLDIYIPHQSEIIEIENFGEPIAWRVEDTFELVLKTDLENLTKFAFSYCDHSIDINHELQLLKIETVDVVGNPIKIKSDRKYTLENRLKYSLAPAHWKIFVEDVRNIYAKIHHRIEQPKYSENPRITIETTNKPEEIKKVPVSEVKPIKKEHHRKLQSCGKHDDEKTKKEKNKLDVSSSTSKRSKSSEHRSKEEKSNEKREHRKKHSEQKESSKHSKGTKISIEDAGDKTTENKDGEKEKIKTSSHKKEQGDEMSKTKSTESASKRNNEKVDAPDSSESKVKPEPKLKSKTSEERKLKREASFEEKDIPIETKFNGSQSHSNKIEIKINDSEVFENDLKPKLKTAKPPNILLFADSSTTKINVKNVLKTIINNDKYILYDFPVNCTDHLQWTDSTALLVVCGSVPSNLTSQMLHFLLTGGHVLCMCSDLLYSVLHCFSTAEVREHELVRFSYGNWKQVQMMHHVFCYQASPAKKQFSKDSDHSSQSNGSRGSSPVAPRTPSSVEIQHNGQKYLLQIQVLGTEETWQTPSLLLASVKNTSGRAIFSQVHLEIDPTEYEDDQNKYAALKASNIDRLEILKDILSHQLEIDCVSDNLGIEFKPGYFLGRHNSKQEFLNDCESIKNNVLETEKITLKFCGKDEDIGVCSPTKMPVYVLACPSNFSTVHYFETLNTKEIGRLVIYSDVLTSSQNVFSKPLVHGLTVIPRRQTSGAGRYGNTWLSPEGCAMFSMQLHIPLDSLFGKYLPLLQQLVVVSIISAIKNLPGCQDLELGLKWPNDIYAYKKVKLGGAIASSTVCSSSAIVNIGVGFNLSNSEPTTCLNDVIKKYNETNGKKTPLVEYERYFAYVFNELEKNIDIVQQGDLDYFYDLYYKYWLHSGMEVTISGGDKQTTKANIIGIDDYGFLKVRTESGKIVNVQPDGNSFNMLTGLIAPKIF